MSFLQLAEILLILGLVLKELIHIFDSIDLELFFCGFREVKVIELATEECLVQRPLGQ